MKQTWYLITFLKNYISILRCYICIYVCIYVLVEYIIYGGFEFNKKRMKAIIILVVAAFLLIALTFVHSDDEKT